jgi:hypothetical protein
VDDGGQHPPEAADPTKGLSQMGRAFLLEKALARPNKRFLSTAMMK